MLTAVAAIGFVLAGYPLWIIAAANFTYLISICMPNIAAWLLRRDQPDANAPLPGAAGVLVTLGVVVAGVWLMTAVLGFQQFGLPTVLFGLGLAYSGAALYTWRTIEDRLAQGLPPFAKTLHLKLTGAMLLVLALDGIGYLLAVGSVHESNAPLVAALEDIFVIVAMLTISVGLVLPGTITHQASEVSKAAKRLTQGTLTEFSQAMNALGRGDLEGAHASLDIERVAVGSQDELGEMAEAFNVLQEKVKEAAHGLDDARENMDAARIELLERHAEIAHLAHHDPADRPAQPHRAGAAFHRDDRGGRGGGQTVCGPQPRPRSLQGSQRRLRT